MRLSVVVVALGTFPIVFRRHPSRDGPKRIHKNAKMPELLGVSRWSPFMKSIRVFSVVGLAVHSD